MIKKNLFIPIEKISIELDAKLVLANQVMDKDTICLIGQHEIIDSISQLFKNGVYVGKNIFKTFFRFDLKFYDAYKKNLIAKIDFLSSKSEKEVLVKLFNNELAMFYMDSAKQP